MKHPDPDRPLRLGTRQSPLAMAQAHEAKARLCGHFGWPSEAVALVPVVATGDKIQDRPLADIGGKALWTRELDGWLAESQIDVAVHSMKDVETIRPRIFTIGAILPREDRSDRLIGATSIADIQTGAIVGTSAPRRAAQLLHHRPDVTVVSIRGNVATRLAKLERKEVDATFLASAGLVRLGEDDVGTALKVEDWLPAAAQGAIGLECRSNDTQTREWLSGIDHVPSHAEVSAERALLEGLGGTCHSPVAVLALASDNRIAIRARLYSEDGRDMVEGSAEMACGEYEAAHALALELLAKAPATITDLFNSA